VRVLTVGNMYPPHHLGGAELVWRSFVGHLRERGHEVRVLTTDHRQPGVTAADDPGVHRELRWWWREHGWPRFPGRERLAVERGNARVFDRHVRELRPDAVAWMACGGMTLSLVERARRAGLPSLALAQDDWAIYGPEVDAWLRAWRRRGPAAAAGAALTGIPTRVDLDSIDRWVAISADTLRRARELGGWRMEGARVIHTGIDAGWIGAPLPHRPWAWRLLNVGRIDDRKGIDTAIDALAHLPPEATLTVAGAGDDQALSALRERAARAGLDGRVTFLGAQDRDRLRAVYAQADAVVFPVRWDEPWGLVPLEAMALGRPVLATGRGGSAEYLRDGENALLFPAGDAAALAARLHDLAADPDLRARLRAGGLATAPRHTDAAFNAALEAALAELCSG
jgi:glycogen synthase